MCGIAGSAGPGAGFREHLKQRLVCLKHRGPDEVGLHVDQGIELGNARLAIIDVVSGQQPSISPAGTVVVLNGEIYNYKEIQSHLRQLGYIPRTNSDTEVIALGFDAWGTGLVSRLRGMFAIAIWCPRDRELLLITDQLGKKPIVYHVRNDGSIFFASESKALFGDLERSGITRTASPQGIEDVATLGYVRVGGNAFVGLHGVPPATIIKYKDGFISETEYWNPNQIEEIDISFEDAAERAKLLLVGAVRRRTISERPLGALLSGGIDSSLICALLSQELAHPLQTFSVGFDNSHFDESSHARAIALALGSDHHEIRLEPDPVLALETIGDAFDQPFADSSAIPMFMISKFAHDSVTVALTGDGGDEFFLGYDRYRYIPKFHDFNSTLRFAGPARNLAEIFARDSGSRRLARAARELRFFPSLENRYVAGMSLMDQLERKNLLTLKIAEQRSMFETYVERLRNLRVHSKSSASALSRFDASTYLPGDLLVKADIASMANSLELRSPLLDIDLVSFALSLPTEVRMRGGERKAILKSIVRDFLPWELLNRPKQGFAIPRASWLRNELREATQDLLGDATFRNRGWFEPSLVKGVLAEHMRGHDRDHMIWPMLCIEIWARNWLDG